MALNREIVRAFLRDVRADGAIPVVVYFPSRLDFRIRARKPAWQSLAQTMLREAGIAHTDLTSCLVGLDPADRFGPGHYAPGGNAAVAECLRGEIRGILRMGDLDGVETRPQPEAKPRSSR
jgi:hypothetical protein